MRTCQACGKEVDNMDGITVGPHSCHPQHYRMQQEILAALRPTITDDMLERAHQAYDAGGPGELKRMRAALDAVLGKA